MVKLGFFAAPFRIASTPYLARISIKYFTNPIALDWHISSLILHHSF